MWRDQDGTITDWLGRANGALLSPTEKVWEDAVAGAQQLMVDFTVKTIQEEITAKEIQEHSGGAPTPPVSAGDLSAEMSAAIGDMWYVDTTAPLNSEQALLQALFDSDQLIHAAENSIIANFGPLPGGGFADLGSLTLLDSNTSTFDLNINGIDLAATWNVGAPPAPPSGAPSSDWDPIIVTGVRLTDAPTAPDPSLYEPSGYLTIDAFGSGFHFDDGFGGAGGPDSDTSFAGTHLHFKVANPTDEQKNAFKHMHDEMNALNAKVQAIPDSEVMTIKTDGGATKQVTGAEIKTLWANYQVSIDEAPAGGYPNGTTRGASTDANGVTHFDIGLLTSYVRSTDTNSYQNESADYLLFHELAHNTSAGQAENSWEAANATRDASGAYPDNEKFANTIADAIESLPSMTGVSPLYTATYGYDATNPGFTIPPPPGGG